MHILLLLWRTPIMVTDIIMVIFIIITVVTRKMNIPTTSICCSRFSIRSIIEITIPHPRPPRLQVWVVTIMGIWVIPLLLMLEVLRTHEPILVLTLVLDLD